MNARWRNRILAAVLLAGLAYAAYFVVDMFDAIRIRDGNFATIEASLAYRNEVERAIKEGRQLPPPAPRPPRFARALYANSDGAVFIELSDKLIAGGRYVFIPTRAADGTITWRCTTERIDSQFLPAACR